MEDMHPGNSYSPDLRCFWINIVRNAFHNLVKIAQNWKYFIRSYFNKIGEKCGMYLLSMKNNEVNHYKSRKKRSSQDSWKTCTLGTPIPQICVVSVNNSVENRFLCMVNTVRK